MKATVYHGYGWDWFGLVVEGSIKIPKLTSRAWDREKTGAAAFDPVLPKPKCLLYYIQ
jgi:hypothetical protein